MHNNTDTQPASAACMGVQVHVTFYTVAVYIHERSTYRLIRRTQKYVKCGKGIILLGLYSKQ